MAGPFDGRQVTDLPFHAPLTGAEAFHIVQTGNSRQVLTARFLLSQNLDNDPNLTADSATRIPTQQAVRAFVTSAGGAYVPLSYLDTDGTLTANSDTRVATQRATKTYVDNAPYVPLTYLDTDPTLAANSDTRVATQKATKAYADGLIAASDAMVFKGVIDCSLDPNYPAADRGWTYRVSVAGKIGGPAGVVVENGDLLICMVDGSPAGNQITVGGNWAIVQTNIDGAVVGPPGPVGANSITGFDGPTGKVVKQLTSAEATAYLLPVIGDSGAGGVNGLVPAPVAGDAAANRFLHASGAWVVPTGSGNVNSGPATDNRLARYDGATGTQIQTSGATLDDNNDLTGIRHFTTTGNITSGAGIVSFSAATQFLLPQSANPTPTAEGDMWWDTDDDVIKVGTGSGTKQFGILRRALISAAAGTAINVGSIPANAQRITISFLNVGTAGTNLILLALGDAGGIELAGYVQTMTTLTTGANVQNIGTGGFAIGFRASAVDTHSGRITMILGDPATNTWVVDGVFDRGGTQGQSIFAGTKALSQPLTQFEFSASGQAFDGGSLSVLIEG